MKHVARLQPIQLASLALIGLASCSATGDRAVPDMAPSRVVHLSFVSADEAARALDGSFARNGWSDLLGAGCDPAGLGLRSGRLVVTSEPHGNSLIIAAGPGHAAEVERALEFVRRLDVPRMAAAGGAGR